MQVASWLDKHLRPKGVGVVIEANHQCLSLRGVRAEGARTVTSAVRGLLSDDPLLVTSSSLSPARVGK